MLCIPHCAAGEGANRAPRAVMARQASSLRHGADSEAAAACNRAPATYIRPGRSQGAAWAPGAETAIRRLARSSRARACYPRAVAARIVGGNAGIEASDGAEPSVGQRHGRLPPKRSAAARRVAGADKAAVAHGRMQSTVRSSAPAWPRHRRQAPGSRLRGVAPRANGPSFLTTLVWHACKKKIIVVSAGVTSRAKRPPGPPAANPLAGPSCLLARHPRLLPPCSPASASHAARSLNVLCPPRPAAKAGRGPRIPSRPAPPGSTSRHTRLQAPRRKRHHPRLDSSATALVRGGIPTPTRRGGGRAEPASAPPLPHHQATALNPAKHPECAGTSTSTSTRTDGAVTPPAERLRIRRR